MDDKATLYTQNTLTHTLPHRVYTQNLLACAPNIVHDKLGYANFKPISIYCRNIVHLTHVFSKIYILHIGCVWEDPPFVNRCYTLYQPTTHIVPFRSIRFVVFYTKVETSSCLSTAHLSILPTLDARGCCFCHMHIRKKNTIQHLCRPLANIFKIYTSSYQHWYKHIIRTAK